MNYFNLTFYKKCEIIEPNIDNMIDKSLKKILKTIFARDQRYVFNQIKKITIKFWGDFSILKLQYYMSLKIPLMHRVFLTD